MNKKKLFIKRLIWDEWNIAHIARHNVIAQEVEEVCERHPVERTGHKNRIFLIGQTEKNRMLTVILNHTEQADVYRPITAYEASKRSIMDYQEEKKRGGEEAA